MAIDIDSEYSDGNVLCVTTIADVFVAKYEMPMVVISFL